MSTIRADKLLQSQGFGSRRQCRQLIADGALRIDGATIRDDAATFDTDGLCFEVDGERWHYRAQVYLALHKPPDIECSRKPSHHPGVMTLLPSQMRERGVQPVGRLDHDTTGLLLLSDDGAFIHAHSAAKRQVPKVYRAVTAEPVTPALVDALCAGVALYDEPEPLAATHCVPCGERELEIVVAQGKYHQVKRMLAAAGNHCAALRRTTVGGLTLDSLNLAPGQWCHLDAAALARLDDWQ